MSECYAPGFESWLFMSTRPLDPLIIDADGHKECLLGNEAIVRGAIESGVAFAAGYPGTPSSEVTDSFARVAESLGICFEYSINEKIALEMAFAASLAGARSICAMKHLGLMYAGDPLSTIPYVGVVAGMVIVSAGDPSCRTSPNEQDQRYLAPMLYIPMLDPSTPGEAYAMTRFAFELSEKACLPVILRPTTRVCHSREVVRYGKIEKRNTTGFKRDPNRFVPIPANARRLRVDLKDRVETARKLMGESEFFKVSGTGKLAILASGAPAGTSFDVIGEAGIQDDVRQLTVGGVFPLPEKQILSALEGVERVLVVEELSTYLEDALHSMLSRYGKSIEVLGKRTGHFPLEFEYTPDLIKRAFHDGLGLGPEPGPQREIPNVPPRPPSLCPGCPHRPSQFALRTVFGEDALIFNDIGCYTLGFGPPLNTADGLLCMGAGFTLAAGVSRVTGKRTVGLLGDSTFFHSGMPALLNAIKEDVNMVALILDNHVTAMTGFQESPGVFFDGEKLSRTVSIEGLVRALGATHVETFDPYDLPETIAALERTRDFKGLSVAIARRSCPSFLSRETHRPYKTGTYEIDHDLCRRCGREADGMRCNSCASEAFERHMARSRSLETGVESEPRDQSAPCSARCPLDLCIQGYIGHIAAGQYEQAFNTIMEQLPLPDSVCRVCHHPCEAACVRNRIDGPVAINELKRFAVDWAARHEIPYNPERDPKCGKKVAIVGSGPSGLAAAHDLKLRGFDVTMFDADDKPGGLLRTGIPEYRLPRDALERDIDRIMGLGVEFVGNRALGRDFLIRDLLDQGFDAVYLAAGAHRGIHLGINGQGSGKKPEVIDALSYLKEVTLGIPFKTGKRVIVVGGGNAAVDAARTARRMGADSVRIVYRRRREEMPAIREEIEAAEKEGVEVLTQIQPLKTDEHGLHVVRTEPGETDSSGRGRPVPVKGSEHLIEADQIIAAIGQAPDPDLFDKADLELDRARDGTLVVDLDTMGTSHPMVFAGGDITDSPRTVTDAIAAGRRASLGIDRLLRGPESADKRPVPPRVKLKSTSMRLGIDRADREARQAPRELESDERTQGFQEVVSSLSEFQAAREAARCMVCGLCGNCRVCLDLFGCPAFYVENGRIQIDPALCMGCGVCADICPNGAIRKVEDRPEEPSK
jgi:indolepyruvate ferredoxin oxidoreductase alpha subunit